MPTHQPPLVPAVIYRDEVNALFTTPSSPTTGGGLLTSAEVAALFRVDPKTVTGRERLMTPSTTRRETTRDHRGGGQSKHPDTCRAAAGLALDTTGYVVACLDCGLPAGAYPTRAEADLLAGVHDRLHHGSNPTAQITGGGVCESCQTRPATTTWHHPAAGAPFLLCTSCAPEPAPVVAGLSGVGA